MKRSIGRACVGAIVLALGLLLGGGIAAASEPGSQFEGGGTDNCIYGEFLGC